jgi:hypothetical protein
MASELQIEANRRNARKSTGPRSASGKKRSSQNALRHGLTKPLSGTKFAQQVETLARRIVGDSVDKRTLALAHNFAEAELELDRVRRVAVAFIERVVAFGCLKPPRVFLSAKEIDWTMGNCFGPVWWEKRHGFPVAPPLPDMPKEEPERTTEAVRRLLPDLVRLERYERRAAARRDQAIGALMQREASATNTT